MAEIDLAPLHERLGEEEIAALAAALEGAGAPPLPRADETAARTLADAIDGDTMTEFLDRLEAFEVSCDIYLPVEFDGRVEVGSFRLGSSQALLDVLEEMKDDLEIVEDPGDLAGDQAAHFLADPVRRIWHVFYLGSQQSLDRHIPLHVHV